MSSLTAADALRALKKFKRLAKQDLLAGELTTDPEFWRELATARRGAYDELMHVIGDEGVEAARRYAVKRHAALPLRGSAGDTAAVKGKKQALEMFFTIVGVRKTVSDVHRPTVRDADADDERPAMEVPS